MIKRAFLAFVLASSPAVADTAQVGTGGFIYITPTGGAINSIVCSLPGAPIPDSGEAAAIMGNTTRGHPPPVVHGHCYNILAGWRIVPIKEGWPYNPGVFANQIGMECSIDADRMGFTCHIP